MKNNILTGIIIALFVAVVILSADAAMPGEGFSFLPKESETAYTTVTVVSSEKIPGISRTGMIRLLKPAMRAE